MADTFIDALFAPKLVACMTAGGDPDVAAMFTVARRVWVDCAAERSALHG